MEKKNDIINNSLVVRMYEDTKECLKGSFYDKDKSKQLGIMMISVGLGIGTCIISTGIGLIIKNGV